MPRYRGPKERYLKARNLKYLDLMPIYRVIGHQVGPLPYGKGREGAHLRVPPIKDTGGH